LQSEGTLAVAHVGLTQVSGDPVSRVRVSFCAGVPTSISTAYLVPESWLATSTLF
jgi:hypothetical protein